MTITAVNGVTLATSETAAIDTGNGAFFSYASSTYDSTVTDSALKGALISGSTSTVSFPLSITFAGGDTVTWTSAPYARPPSFGLRRATPHLGRRAAVALHPGPQPRQRFFVGLLTARLVLSETG